MLHHHPTDQRCYPVEQKPDHRDVPDTYPKGRRCIHENQRGHRCITRLNQFNPGPLCLLHGDEYEAQLARLLDDAD
jgi:hypothetical protein